MKSLLESIHEQLKGGEYKKELLTWLLSILFLTFSTLFVLMELKHYFALMKSKEAIDQSYFRIQPQVVKLKEDLGKVDWKRSYKKEVLEMKVITDLTNLERALKDIRSLSNEREDIFFIAKEIVLRTEKNNKPILSISGERISFK